MNEPDPYGPSANAEPETPATANVDLITNATTKALRAVVSALLMFGIVHWTGEQAGAFYLAFEAVLGVPLTVWLARRRTSGSQAQR